MSSIDYVIERIESTKGIEDYNPEHVNDEFWQRPENAKTAIHHHHLPYSLYMSLHEALDS